MGFGFAIPFLPYYLQELGITDPDKLTRWVGLSTSIPSLLMGLMGPLWGFLSDRIGRKLNVLRALAAGAIIIGLLAIAGDAGTVLFLRICQGLFTGTITAAATFVAAETPRDRLARSMGFLSSSTFVGYSLGPFLGGFTAEYFGYRPAFLTGSGILVIGFILVLILVKESSSHTRQMKRFSIFRTNTSGKWIRRLGDLHRLVKGDLGGSWIFLLLVLFLGRFIHALPSPYMPLYVQKLHGGFAGATALTGIVAACIGLAGACGGIIFGRLGDSFPTAKVITLCFGMAAVFALPAALWEHLAGFILSIVLAAFFVGGIEPNVQSAVSRRTAVEHRGLIFGVQTLIGSIGWFFAPLLGGVAVRFWSLRAVYGVYCIILMLCLILMLVFLKIHLVVPALHSDGET